MAPDRGLEQLQQASAISMASGRDHDRTGAARQGPQGYEQRDPDMQQFMKHRAAEGQNFTLRGVLVGLAVGLVICFSNMYFGLQTGWVSGMSMPASLIGFAFFRTFSRHLDLPFTEVENVLVQTVAGTMGTMPLGCGLVGVMPALNYMLKPKEQGPVTLSLGSLILWSLGLCYFGVVFAVPLRRQVIIREKLKFPSGTATALMIGVLHGKEGAGSSGPARPSNDARIYSRDQPERPDYEQAQTPLMADSNADDTLHSLGDSASKQFRNDWRGRVRILIMSFAVSGFFTLTTYFFPILRSLPVFGWYLADTWLWTLNPSLAYVGQGIIMGPATTLHMLLGAVVGWGILSPLAKYRGWAPGHVEDWESGSRGWIIWVSLAIMLADSVVSLGYLMARSVLIPNAPLLRRAWRWWMNSAWNPVHSTTGSGTVSYEPIRASSEHDARPGSSLLGASHSNQAPAVTADEETPEIDAPPEHLVSNNVVWSGLVLSVGFCIFCIHMTFGDLVPIYATIIAVLMALVLSIMGVRALGETDLNPVSGISKLAQLFFALIIPQSNKNSVIINLVAGAVSEAGALQAGDLMQDLKTGHILGAAPKAQFWGQMIGSSVGAVVSALIYRLYTSVYPIPGELFQVPTGWVWIFTARLVTGKGLPDMAAQWASGAAVIFAVTTSVRMFGTGASWHPYVPGGIAVAVGKLHQSQLGLLMWLTVLNRYV
jgi:OPT family oligopeptide transporter